MTAPDTPREKSGAAPRMPAAVAPKMVRHRRGKAIPERGSGRLRCMTRRPVYAGDGGIGVAVASWLAGALPAHRGGVVPPTIRPDLHAELLATEGPTGSVAWDVDRRQPVAAIDTSGEAWIGDDVVDDAAVGEALASRGYRRGEMRVTRRVVAPDGGGTAVFRATLWTSAAVRASAGDPGTVWK